MSEREIKIVRKGTTTSKLTIASDGRLELKLHDGVDKAGEEWLLEFSKKVVSDALASLPLERSLRGRFRRRDGHPSVTLELSAGGGKEQETLKYYVSKEMGLQEPPATV